MSASTGAQQQHLHHHHHHQLQLEQQRQEQQQKQQQQQQQQQQQLRLPPPPPPPSGDALALLAALSDAQSTSSRRRHAAALAARDHALNSSPDSYGRICVDFSRTLASATPGCVPDHGWARAFEHCVSSGGGGAGGGNADGVVEDHDGGGAGDDGGDGAARAFLERLRSDAAGTSGPWIHLRQMAGLLLKNALAIPPPAAPAAGDTTGGGAIAGGSAGGGGFMKLPQEAAAEIKSNLLRCLVDTHPAIRRVASSAISASCVDASLSSSFPYGATTLASTTGRESLPLPTWQDLLPFLLGCVETASAIVGGTGASDETTTAAAAALDGSLLTLRKVLEDAPAQFERESGPAFHSRLVPALLGCLSNPDPRVRAEGLRCLNCLVGTMPGCLVVRMNDYLGGLSALTGDANVGVRRLVCQTIVNLMSQRSEYLQPHFQSIAEFMLVATGDTDEGVALEACEFWLAFASAGPDPNLESDSSGGDGDDGTGGQATPEMVETIRLLLPRLVPTFVKGIVYPEERREELMEQNALDESNAADREQDVAPVFHTSKSKAHGKDGGGGSGSGGGGEESDDDDDDDLDDDAAEWTLRKCCAASLDTLASLYGSGDVLPPLLPVLQESLSHSDPWIREAGVLALGAVAEGCSDAMAEHMAQLHPFLLQQMTDPSGLPQLKSIAAWTLGRYADWAVAQVHIGQPEIIGKVTEVLMGRLLDPNRRVQVAACSAFGVFVESTGDLIVPYLEPVFMTLAQALRMYQTRSLMVLFDTLGTIADFVGPVIGEGNLPSIYVPPLLHMWNELAKRNPLDRTLLPLMEGMASIALVVGINYQPWALETFEGCVALIESCMMLLASQDDDDYGYDDEEADAIVCAEDLIDGMIEGLGSNFAALVASSARYAEHFLSILHSLAGHEIAGVRMSAFAIMGDLARHCPQVIQSGTGELLTEAISCMDPMHPSVCNNAVWAVGEVCVRCGNNAEPLRPYADDIVQNLISLLMGNAVDASGNIQTIPGLAENAAACMGRLAKVDPTFVARDLPRFLVGWCEGMAKISDPTERSDTFQGFILALRTNPSSIHTATGGDAAEVITAILFAVVSWHIPPDNMTADLLSGEYGFRPFPQESAEVGNELGKLLHDVKNSVGEALWGDIAKKTPVNVRRLMREVYQL